MLQATPLQTTAWLPRCSLLPKLYCTCTLKVCMYSPGHYHLLAFVTMPFLYTVICFYNYVPIWYVRINIFFVQFMAWLPLIMISVTTLACSYYYYYYFVCLHGTSLTFSGQILPLLQYNQCPGPGSHLLLIPFSLLVFTQFHSVSDHLSSVFT